MSLRVLPPLPRLTTAVLVTPLLLMDHHVESHCELRNKNSFEALESGLPTSPLTGHAAI